MCTAIRYNEAFGRTLDYERHFGEELVRFERGEGLKFLYEGERISEHTVLGVACRGDEMPLFFDGMNDAGLCAAALNFPRYAFYRGRRCDGVNLASYEVISYILSLYSSVEEVKYGLRGLTVTSDASLGHSPSPLHWMVADRRESIVIEPLRCGVRILEDPADILTNAPSLDYHLTRLSDYMGLDSVPPENRLCKGEMITAYSRGAGAIGLPGDWSSSSRFVRAFFVKEKLDTRSISDSDAVFEVLRSVSVPYGCVLTENGESVGTLYTSCMDMRSGVYRYRRYGDINEKTVGFI